MGFCKNKFCPSGIFCPQEFYHYGIVYKDILDRWDFLSKEFNPGEVLFMGILYRCDFIEVGFCTMEYYPAGILHKGI